MRLTDEQRAVLTAAGLHDLRACAAPGTYVDDELWGKMAEGQTAGQPACKLSDFAEGWAAWTTYADWDSGYFDDPIAALTYAQVEQWGGQIPQAKLDALNRQEYPGARQQLKRGFTG